MLRSQLIPPLRRAAKRGQKFSRLVRIFALAGLRELAFFRTRLHLPRNQHFPVRSSQADGVSVRLVDPEEVFTRSLPDMPGEPSCPHFFLSHRTGSIPATFVAEIQNGRIWCEQQSAVFTADGRLIPEFSKDMWGPQFHNTYLRLSLPRPRFLPGRTLSLVTPEATANYHHWMVDLIPRVSTAERAGWDIRAFDHVLVKDRGYAFQKETLARLGLDPAKIIHVKESDHFHAVSLVVPSFRHNNLLVNQADFRAVRRLFLPEILPPPTGRRLYLSRRDATHRRVVNEAELLPILRAHGFEEVSMSNLSVAEQAEILSGASVILGPNGSALANLVFAHPDARVIEFHAPGWVVGFNWMICANLGIHYTALVGRGPRPAPHLPAREIKQDIDLDPAVLKLALDKLPAR